MKNFVQQGETLSYANSSGSTIAAGSAVVVGNQIGVAKADIADGESGPLAMDGVFELPKVTAAVIAQGEDVAWDVSTGKFDDNQITPAAGDITGACTAWEAAGNGATTVKVKINTGVGTVN